MSSGLTTSITSRYCTVSKNSHSEEIQIQPALVCWKDSVITRVETCNDAEYSDKLGLWQKEIPELRVLENKLLSPAFINPHTHIAMAPFRGLNQTIEASKGNMIEDLFYAVESHLEADDVRAFARMGAYENLLAGVGMVWDHYYHGQALAEALYDTGLTGVIAPTLQDLSGPGKKHWERELSHTQSIAQNKVFTNAGIFASLGPHATDTVSAKLWATIIKESQTLDLPIHYHLAQTISEYQKVTQREGMSPVRWLEHLGLFAEGRPNLAVHNVFMDHTDFNILKNAESLTLCFCPFSALIFAIPAKIEYWQQHQLKWCVATDAVASNDSMNVQKELRYLAGHPMQGLSYGKEYNSFFQTETDEQAKRLSILQKLDQKRSEIWEKTRDYRSPSWLLNKVWKTPGDIHPQVKLGQIAPGHLANLIVWDLDAPSIWPARDLRVLAMGDTSLAIDELYCAGKLINPAQRTLSTITETPLYKEHACEAKHRLESLLKRIGYQMSF